MFSDCQEGWQEEGGMNREDTEDFSGSENTLRDAITADTSQ